MRKSELWRGSHTCCVITGASRGFGKAITLCLAKHFNECHRCDHNHCQSFSLSFVLISRDVSALYDVSHEVSSIDSHIKIVDIIGGSLDDAITMELYSKTLKTISENKIYDQVILIHNAGTLGNVNLLTNQLTTDDEQMLNQYFEINLFSVMKMTAVFIQLFSHINHRMIINVTSLSAIVPFKGLSLYCIGKAARDAYFRSVALENTDISVLSYSPGPLETDMLKTLKEEGHNREDFSRLYVLKPEESVQRMIEIIEVNRFKSGNHIDYYDPIE